MCVCVCVGVLSCQSSYPSRAASHSQQHDRAVKQSAWPKAFNFEMAAQWIPIQMNREQHTRICTQMIWHACTQVCTYTCTNTGICGVAHPLSITSTYPPPHTHSLRGKEEMSFLRIEYSGMSFATLTLHMQNPALCIHVERHKTGTTIKNVIFQPMVWPRLSAENFHHQYR